MNTNEVLGAPGDQPPFLPPIGNPPVASSFGYWARRFLAGNPFYLVSAALLLFGINRLAVDPQFLGAEEPKLIFNFSALQFYEVLLVVVALFLARRRIWYDSTLLVVVENALVLVPLILVTQAVLIGRGLALALCLAAAVLAVLRFGSLRKFLPELNLPPRLLAIGSVLLAANLVVPLLFRSIIENGTDAWGRPSHFAWMVLLPLFQLGALFLPRPVHWSGESARRSWLPLLFLSLWITASGVHLWCVGYVGNLVLQPFLFAPLGCAVAWTLVNRLTDFAPELDARWRAALLVPPMLMTFLALGHGMIFVPLTFLNIALYAGLCWFGRDRAMAGAMLQASLVALVAAMPESVGQHLLSEFTRAKSIGVAVGGLILGHALFSRRPDIGLCGAVIITLGARMFFPMADMALPLQMGFVFFLLHSLRWEDAMHQGAAGLRIFAALAWVAHSFYWTRDLQMVPGLTVALGALSLLIACAVFRWLRHAWPTMVVPLAAVLALLVTPAHFIFGKVKTSPTGLLALVGSFILFGLGTVLALTKHRWHSTPQNGSDSSK